MNCEYQTYRGNKLQDCGKVATHRGVKPPKRCYCADHAALVSKPGGILVEPLNGTPTGK